VNAEQSAETEQPVVNVSDQPSTTLQAHPQSQPQSVRAEGGADEVDVTAVESLTLPRIEHVLRSEGVPPVSISQQIDSLRQRRNKLAGYTCT